MHAPPRAPETVENILDVGGISSFHNVVENKTEFIQLPGYDLWLKTLPEVLISLQIASSPSSSSLTAAALDSLYAVVEKEYSDKKYFREKLIQFRENLDPKLENRPGHNQLRYICLAIDNALKHLGILSDNNIDPVKKRLKDFIIKFNQLYRQESSRSQADNLKEALKELCGKQKRTSWTFLLYGSSNTIATALAELDVEQPMILLIAEGRPKTIHGAYNTPTYLDAESYANLIRSVEPKNRKSKIIIIPDALIATAINLGACRKSEFNHSIIQSDILYPKVDAVLFGVNGIFIDPSVTSSNTAGAYGAALVAKSLQVPVIVIGNATKIWDKYEKSWQFRLRAKENKWLSSLSKIRDRLSEEEQLDAEIDWNPREDYIPLEYTAAIVTNFGILYSNSKNPESVLKKWHEQALKDCNIENI